MLTRQRSLRAVTVLAIRSTLFGTALLAGPNLSPAATIDGTIIRSFPSPLGTGTYGIAMDNDGVHAWINRRPAGAFTRIDLFGNETPGARSDAPMWLPQGFEMNADGELWLISRDSNDEDAVRMTTSGTTTAMFPLRDDGGAYFDNPNDVTLYHDEIFVVSPNRDGMHRFQADGTFIETVWFEPGAMDPAFTATDAITYDGTNFWVARGASGSPTPVAGAGSMGAVLRPARPGRGLAPPRSADNTYYVKSDQP